MKNKFIKILSLTALILPLISLTGCNSGDNAGSSSHGDSSNIEKPDKFDLSGYSCNINAGNTVGIKFVKNESGKKNLALGKSEIGSNKILVSKDGINSVEMEFEKIVPNLKESIINKTKEIIAHNPVDYVDNVINEATISFKILEGFTYSLYLEEDSTEPIPGFENIVDNSMLDINPKTNFVTLSGLTNGHSYYLHYSGKGNIVRYIQGDLNYKIDKLYSMRGFTFLSFCLNDNSSGIGYERFNYNDDERVNNYHKYMNGKIYVIDNSTGYIYDFNKYNILSFQNGLLWLTERGSDVQVDDRPFLFDLSVNDNDELEVRQLYSNNSIRGKGFKDKYGNNFISNEFIDTYDEKTKTTYYTSYNYLEHKYKYFLTTDLETIRIENYGIKNGSSFKPFKEIKLLNSEGQFVDIPLDKEFKIKYDTFDVFSGLCPTYCKDGYVYYMHDFNDNFNSSSNIIFGRYDLRTKKHFSINCFETDDQQKSINLTGDSLCNTSFIHKGLFLIYENNNLYYIDDVWSDLDKLLTYKDNMKLLIESCNFGHNTFIEKVDVNGLIKCELEVNNTPDGKADINVIEIGSFDPLDKVKFQPIN